MYMLNLSVRVSICTCLVPLLSELAAINASFTLMVNSTLSDNLETFGSICSQDSVPPYRNVRYNLKM